MSSSRGKPGRENKDDEEVEVNHITIFGGQEKNVYRPSYHQVKRRRDVLFIKRNGILLAMPF